jgi:hypothetical protein
VNACPICGGTLVVINRGRKLKTERREVVRCETCGVDFARITRLVPVHESSGERPPGPPPHGTEQRYFWDRRNGFESCESCVEEHNSRVIERNELVRQRKAGKVLTATG